MIVCVDASVVLKFVTREPESDLALGWLRAWGEEEVAAPTLLPLEVAAVLRRKVHRGEISRADSAEALTLLKSLGFNYVWDWDLLQAASSLATALAQPTTYDTLYLALALRLNCDLWTADDQFALVSSPRYGCVRSISEFASKKAPTR